MPTAALRAPGCDREVNRAAHFLLARGLQPGDRFNLHLGNCPQFLAAKTGTVMVPTNPVSTPEEMAYILTHANYLSFAETPSASEVVDLSAGSSHHLSSMITLLLHVLRLLPVLFGGHRQLALENLALRQQLAVYKRMMTRPRLRRTDRLFWVGLARIWAGWRFARDHNCGRATRALMPSTRLRPSDLGTGYRRVDNPRRQRPPPHRPSPGGARQATPKAVNKSDEV
jgi:hypothetical protein